MKYTIIGHDGKSYGPVSADELRQWIRQSRVESRTPVFVAGMADWTFAGLLPEFAPEFSGPPPVFAAPRPGAAAGAALPAGTNPLAIWGFICGVLCWVFCGCCLPVTVLGLTFSIIALVQINARAETGNGRGYAIAGIVLSASNLLWTLGMTLIGLLNNASQVQWNIGN